MKERLDVILVKRGLAPSREKAKTLIKEGRVTVNGQREEKPSVLLDTENVSLQVKEGGLPYVSRGGLKLEKALRVWEISLQGRVCVDIGASAGGFTDCMLQNGAAKVYAVDVGTDQLDQRLRADDRVVCMEQTNFRYIKPEDIGEPLDFASADVSFISLTRILIPAGRLLKRGGRMVCLIKPQFEAGREKLGKNGVVRDSGVHRQVIERVADFAQGVGFSVLGLDYSPIRGPEGNIEYLLYLEKGVEPEGLPETLAGREAEQYLEELRAKGRGLSGSREWRERVAEIVEGSRL